MMRNMGHFCKGCSRATLFSSHQIYKELSSIPLNEVKVSPAEVHQDYKSIEDMPGPRPVLPFYGTSWIYSFLFGKYSHDESITTAKQDFLSLYGPIYKERLGGTWVVSVHEPKHIELVMRRQGKYPLRIINEANVYLRIKNPETYNTVGLVDSVGQEWFHLRQKSSPPLLKPGAVAPFTGDLLSIADEFVNCIRNQSGEEEAVHEIPDLRPYLYNYGLEAIWKVTLGKNLGALRSDVPEEAKNLTRCSRDLFDSFASLSTSTPWWKLWSTPTFRKFAKSEESVVKIVNQHMKLCPIAGDNANGDRGERHKENSILQQFLSIKDFNVKDIHTIIVDFIVAGIPTTSYYLSLLLHRLGQEPEIQARIHEELDALYPGKEVTLVRNDLKPTPILSAVIHEGFRLTTIIPAIVRILPEDIICDEYRIPANTVILMQTRAASLSERYFSSPRDFIPDRWIKESSENVNNTDKVSSKLRKEGKANQFLVLPFGFGPRMCVGKRLAEKEITALLTKIFLNYSLRSEGEIEVGNFYIIGPKSPVSLKFIERVTN